MLFQGRNYRIDRVGKNRFEFRSQYALLYGTGNEIAQIITSHTREARQSAIELTEARRRVLEAAANDGAFVDEPVKASMPLAPTPPSQAVATPSVAERAKTPTAPRARRSSGTHGLAVVEHFEASATESDKKKPRRYGLAHLRALRAQEEAEKPQS